MANYKALSQQVQSGTILSSDQFTTVMSEAAALFKAESNVLQLQGAINVISNIHGQFSGLQEITSLAGSFNESNQFLFLGNIVDRGTQSVECLQYLLLQKLQFPKQVFIIRGNHECRQIGEIYGFLTELKEKYGDDDIATALFTKCCEEVFYSMPLAATINNNVFCVHGGLSPELSTLKDISLIDRFQEVPNSGLFTDLLWSDPLTTAPLVPKNVNMKQFNLTEEQKKQMEEAQKKLEEAKKAPMVDGFAPSPRGAGVLWNVDISTKFCEENNFKYIVRGHQLVQEGYEWVHNNKVLTLFSQANYCDKCANKAAFLKLNNDGNHSIVQSNLFRDVTPNSC